MRRVLLSQRNFARGDKVLKLDVAYACCKVRNDYFGRHLQINKNPTCILKGYDVIAARKIDKGEILSIDLRNDQTHEIS